ncbi:aminotransferase class V-fold PLP-dependent enzyme [bacterium]|nr:aminotransferase class V-fold PLP-dependent enzyme [bacterium]
MTPANDTRNAVKPAGELPGHRGLLMEEGLLIDQSEKGRCGVDLPELSGKSKGRLGVETRAEIGLPEVTEPQVIRHFVRLSQQNYSIDTGFFPLGSCTMKHNPRLNEKMARLNGFANIHPLQPEATAQGALELMYELQHWLAEMSGLPGVTLAPAAGAHGEFAGMMVIRKAHEVKGKPRKKVLVPDSAHGTNPATAAICGYEIETIPTDAQGHVNFDVAKTLVNEDVAAMMLTNPNTGGKFEPMAHALADLLHEKGAYFYCDGANFNAIAGRVRPADFGVDVMHFNLHKTFSTPHGGGGPGHGPVAVRKELAEFLPVPRIVKKGDLYALETEAKHSIGRIKGFHGHFGMAVRALTYMMAHGGEGIRQASEDAVLNANYIRAKLHDLYHVPFDGICMHECLLTDKKQKEKGISTMDIAKTLVEYGFHPMTVYFPLMVQGAMLIEPTESETRESIDEFINTMRWIATEVNEGRGEALKQNPVSAPRRRLDEVKAAKNPVLTWKQ